MSSITGVVVHRADFQEADRFIELMSVERGRIRLRAPQARRSRRRFGGGLDVFAEVRLHLAPQRRPQALPTIDHADIVDPRLGLRQALARTAVAALLCHAVRRLVPPEEQAAPLCRRLSAALDHAAAGAWPQATTFLVDLARSAGMMPSLACRQCGTRQAPLGLLADHGELACTACQPRVAPLPPGVLGALASGPLDDGDLARCLVDVMMWVLERHGGLARGALASHGWALMDTPPPPSQELAPAGGIP